MTLKKERLYSLLGFTNNFKNIKFFKTSKPGRRRSLPALTTLECKLAKICHLAVLEQSMTAQGFIRKGIISLMNNLHFLFQ